MCGKKLYNYDSLEPSERSWCCDGRRERTLARTVLGRSKIFTPEVIDDIHMKAELGRYRMRGFSMFKKIPHWDELIFLPGTLTRFVIEGYREKCDQDVLGARFAKKPIELDIPVYITGMSFGALSIEAKMALAKGASMAGTATCSGEGGMIPPERDLSTKWYYQIIQSRYGFNPHHLMLADAVEFFIGQGCKVGLGGHLMGQKVTEQVAEMRSLPAGIDQRSPAATPTGSARRPLAEGAGDARGDQLRDPDPAQARRRARLRRRAHGGQVRAGHHLPRRRRGRHRPHVASEETGIPLMAAIPRRGARSRTWAWRTRSTSSWRRHPQRRRHRQVPRARRHAVAIGHSSLMALNCNKEIPGVTDYEGTIGVPAGQCYHCHTGRCPVGITTQDPSCASASTSRRRPPRLQLPAHAHARGADARARLRQDEHPQPRARGPGRAHDRGRRDGARAAAGTDYIPGVSESRALEEIKTMLDRYLENPVDELPAPERVER